MMIKNRKSTAPRRIDPDHVSITDLPTEILIEIFSRLPLSSIVKCRVLSWYMHGILTGVSFAKFHFNGAPTCTLVRNLNAASILRFVFLVEIERDMLRRVCDQVCSSAFDLRSYEDCVNMTIGGKFMLPDIPEKPEIRPGTLRVTSLVVNSCNGVLCLCGSSNSVKDQHDSIVIYNPVTGEYSRIPLPEFDGSLHYIACLGLGFCPEIDKYKVLIMVRACLSTTSDVSSTVCMVYTLGSGVWRTIGKVPEFLGNKFVPVYLNGALHWHRGDNVAEDTILVSFNMMHEKFQLFPSHYHAKSSFGAMNLDKDMEFLNEKFNRDFEAPKCKQSMGVLRDRLFLCDASSNFPIKMWVMGEYGVKESWFMEPIQSCNWKLWPTGSYLPIYLIFYEDDGYLLMYHENNGFVFYDGCNHRLSKLRGFNSNFVAIAHVPSFVPLGEIVGDTLEILNMRSRLLENVEQGGNPLYLVEVDNKHRSRREN